MTDRRVYEVAGESAMVEFGRELAAELGDHELVFVKGDLGAGKTTLIRGILAGLGHRGVVPSPTYTLLESYRPGGREVVHMDLYRLEDPGELEMLGVRDFLGACLCLVEWPERATALLPPADRVIEITGSGGEERVIVVGPPRIPGR